ALGLAAFPGHDPKVAGVPKDDMSSADGRFLKEKRFLFFASAQSPGRQCEQHCNNEMFHGIPPLANELLVFSKHIPRHNIRMPMSKHAPPSPMTHHQVIPDV